MSYGNAPNHKLPYFYCHCESRLAGRGNPIHPSTALSQGHCEPDAGGRGNPKYPSTEIPYCQGH